MTLWNAYIADIQFQFQKHKQMAEKAFDQLSDDEFFKKPGEEFNSVAIIVKHLSGNLKSRWTNFLQSDGEKDSRDRDAEFVIGEDDTRFSLVENWDAAWLILLGSLSRLVEADIAKTITIRGEEHTVLQAIHRALTHAAYHVGQITYLARLAKKGGWNWITVPPGTSNQLKDHRYLA